MLGRMRLRLLVSLLPVLLFACDEPGTAPDAGTGSPTTDAGPPRCAPEPTGTPRAVFTLPRTGDEPFFDLPFPSDLRRTPEGTIDVRRFPNPRSNGLVRRYVDIMSRTLDGFATNGAVYLRLSHPVDPSTLPATPEASLEGGASAFLVDVDPDSPDRGARHPVVVHYQDCETRYWPAHTVAMRPVYGLPLASARRYAAVLTDGVHSADNAGYGRDADFEALIAGGGDADVAAAREVYGDVFEVLGQSGVAMERVIAVTVFTTQDAIGETIAIRDWMVDAYPAPSVTEGSLTVAQTNATFTEVRGLYGPVPIFQAGEVPYQSEGGAIVLDASGAPTVHGEYDARFALTIPTTEMPADGFPIAIYAHGTGGDYRSFVHDETAQRLARLGIAAMGVDQIHHGTRNPTSTDPALLFFNFTNPDAGRDNNRQSALDVVQQARLLPALTVPSALLEGADENVRFDPSQVYFVGHSQGGLNGPLYLGIDDSARGAVLSAASGVLTPTLIHKVEPLEIPSIVRGLLGLPGATWQDAFALEGFTVEHPIATLLQTWVEASDTTNYAHLIALSPRPGFAPKSVLMTEGLLDAYAPPDSIEALAGAMGAPLLEPVHRPVPALSLRGLSPAAPPASGNVAEGLATMGLLQFPEDGHFAFQQNPAAAAQALAFLASLAQAGGPGVIPAP